MYVCDTFGCAAIAQETLRIVYFVESFVVWSEQGVRSRRICNIQVTVQLYYSKMFNLSAITYMYVVFALSVCVLFGLH